MGASAKSEHGVAGILAFVVALGVGFFVASPGRRTPRETVQLADGPRYDVDLRGDEPQRGPADALVTVVEFADTQCPMCAQGAPALYGAVDARPEVRLVFKHFPLPRHERAIPAAWAAWAAHQQDAFWEVLDLLYLESGRIDRVRERASELGLSLETFDVDRASDQARADVDDDRLAGGRLGIAATPVFFVNGHRYVGSRSPRAWAQILDAELDIARARLADGVPRSEILESLVRASPSVGASAPSFAPEG